MTTDSQGAAGPAMNARGVIVPQRVRLYLRVRDKGALLSVPAEVASAATGLARGAILAVLQKREALGSTGVEWNCPAARCHRRSGRPVRAACPAGTCH